jgi:hypothetical protein
MDIIITITDREKEILEHFLGEDEIQSWLQHAIDNKLRQRVDASVLQYTDYNPSKMSMEDKMSTLSGIDFPPRDDGI